MLTRQLGSGWMGGLETLHRFNMDSIVVSRKWVYKAGREPDDWRYVVLEEVEKVWIYAIVRGNEGLRKVTACMAAHFAYEPNDKLLQYLKVHEEEWLESEAIEIPSHWTNTAVDDTLPVGDEVVPRRLSRSRAFDNLLSATLLTESTVPPET